MTMTIQNPAVMKSKSEPSYAASAYPLKALRLPENDKKSNYLHIITKQGEKKKYAELSHVLPMINPYTKKEAETKTGNSYNQNHLHRYTISF